MALKDFITSVIDWAAPKIKRFFGGASSFVDETVDIPKYIHGTGLNKQFYKTIENMNDDDILNFVKDYSENAYKEMVKGSINGGTRLDAFRKMHKNYKREVLEGYGREHSAQINMINAFNALDYGDAFKINSQKQLDKVYATINQANFHTEYFKHNIRLAEQGKGMFKEFAADFDFSNGGRNLNKKQMQTLGNYFDEGGFSEKVAAFTADYLPETAEDASRLNYNLGMQKRYLRTDTGQSQLGIISGGRKSPIAIAMKKDKKHRDVYNAYRSHLTNSLATEPDIDTPWNKPLGFREFVAQEGYGGSELDEMFDSLNSQMNKINAQSISSGDPDHSGLGLWQLAKNHPVISTALATSAIYGVTELTEEDSL